MHHGKRQHRVGAGPDGKMLVGQRGRACAVGVDDDEPRALAPGLLDERPKMHVVAVDVRAPRENQPGVGEVLGAGAELHAVDALQRNAARLRADGAGELRRSQPMEEAAVHRPKTELPDRPRVRIRQDALRAELFCDQLQLLGNDAQRLIPRDALERVRLAALHAAVTRRPLRRAGLAAHGIEQAVRRVDALQILRDLAAEKSTRDRMRRVARDLDRALGDPALGAGQRFDRDQHAAGVGAVMRADRMNNFGLSFNGSHAMILFRRISRHRGAGGLCGFGSNSGSMMKICKRNE